MIARHLIRFALLAGSLAPTIWPPPAAAAGAVALRRQEPYVRIVGASLRAPLQGARTTAAYGEIINRGDKPERLLDVRCDCARAVEIHEMRLDGDVMRMRRLSELMIPAGGSLRLSPGGNHLMVIVPDPALRAGDAVTMVMTFERSGRIPVTFRVQP